MLLGEEGGDILERYFVSRDVRVRKDQNDADNIFLAYHHLHVHYSKKPHTKSYEPYNNWGDSSSRLPTFTSLLWCMIINFAKISPGDLKN